MKKLILLAISGMILFTSCQKAQIEHTQQKTTDPFPWPDSSDNHPKNDAFRALLQKYTAKGLPGISLLVSDHYGTWVGAAGYADIEKKISFRVDQVSKIASITKLFIGTLVFKMIEDSTNTHIGYNDLYEPLTKWLPASITSHLANGDKVTLGQCMKHETGIPDLIDEDKFYLAVLNNPVKKWEQEELLEFIYD